MTIKLVVVDDHEVVRRGVEQIVAQAGDIRVVGEASQGEQGIGVILEKRPDVALVDVRMPELDGLTCLGRLQSEGVATPVIMFSGYDNPTYIARAVALGAAGYLSKAASADQLVDAIRRAAAGEPLWSREELRRMTGALSTPRESMELEAPLTRREGEVLKQLAVGLSNKEIALALGISYETVKEHVQHLLRKIGVADRTQAAVWAVRQGIA